MTIDRQPYGNKPHVLLSRAADNKTERLTCTICDVGFDTDLADWRARLDFAKRHNGCHKPVDAKVRNVK